MIAQEREEQGENVHVEAARFGADQRPMIAQEREEQGESYLTDHYSQETKKH